MDPSAERVGASAPPRARKRSNKLVIGGIAIALAVAYLIFAAARGATTYYLTVAEVIAQGPTDRLTRVAGTVVGASIAYSPLDGQLQFDITDESGRLAVVYDGAPPDMLRDGADTVVEGRYAKPGLFEADEIILKCPSKYEAAP